MPSGGPPGSRCWRLQGQIADAWLLSGWLALDRGAREEARAAFQEFLERCAQQGRTVAPEHEVHRGLRLAGDA